MTDSADIAHLASEQVEVTLSQVRQWAIEALGQAQVPDPEVDAELLMAHALGISRGELGVRLVTGVAIDDEQARLLRQLVSRRVEREPLQHILGVAWFRSLTLSVGPGVFVPRPETEQLAGMAIDTLRSLVDPAPLAVDLGTGSGAIALSLATEVPHARVFAVEKSADALPWTRVNFEALGGDNATLVTGDLADGSLTQLFPELLGQVSVVVSNPPYIPTDAVPRDPEVRLYDPHVALFGGEDGLDVVRQVSRVGLDLARPGGQLMLEHGELQGQSIRQLLAEDGWRSPSTHRDLTGRDRFTTATRA
jgi:release factor glutamine methyltransferase